MRFLATINYLDKFKYSQQEKEKELREFQAKLVKSRSQR